MGSNPLLSIYIYVLRYSNIHITERWRGQRVSNTLSSLDIASKFERDHIMGKGRAPCCDKTQVMRGPWSPAEDLRLITFIQKHGHENWRALPKQAGQSPL